MKMKDSLVFPFGPREATVYRSLEFQSVHSLPQATNYPASQ
jgi:hypothetical protein